MQREEAVKLVNQWIADYHRYLKDGGGSTGMHAVPRDELIKRISDLLGDGKPIETPKPVKKGKKIAAIEGD